MSCSGSLSSATSCLLPCEYAGCLIQILRTHIGDWDNEWSDSRLLDILKAAAYQVSSEVTCIDVPEINLCTGDFNTNPFLYPSYVNLWILKSACIIDQGQLRVKAIQEGLKAVCGPASLDIRTGGRSYQILFSEGPCAAYKDMLENLCFRSPLQTASFCSQIVGTFVSQYYCGYR